MMTPPHVVLQGGWQHEGQEVAAVRRQDCSIQVLPTGGGVQIYPQGDGRGVQHSPRSHRRTQESQRNTCHQHTTATY